MKTTKRPQRFLGAAIGVAQLGMGIYGMINKANAEKKAVEENNRNIDNANAENTKSRLQTDSLNMKNFESNSTSFYSKGGIKYSTIGGTIVGHNKKTNTPIYDAVNYRKTANTKLESKTLSDSNGKSYNPSEIEWYDNFYKKQSINDSIKTNINRVIPSKFAKGGIKYSTIKTKYNKGGVKFKTDELQKLDEFEVVAKRLPKKGEVTQTNKLADMYHQGVEGAGIHAREFIKAFNPEYNAELALTPDSTTAFRNMMEKRNINAPRATTIAQGYQFPTDFIRRKVIDRSPGFNFIDESSRKEYRDFYENPTPTPKKAYGGKVKSKFANGGNAGVTREASDMSIAYGARHEESNPQQGGGGVPYGNIEVEGGGARGNQAGEVIKHEGQQDFIFSDRIPFDNKNTFAQVAQAITKSKANLENLIQLASKEVNDEKAKINFAKNIPEKSTIERNISKKMFKVNQIKSEIAKINDEIEQLKQAQLEKGTAMGLYDEQGQPISEDVNEDVNEAQEFSVGGFLNSTGFTAGMGIAQTGLNLVGNIVSANQMKKLKTPSYTPVVAGQTGRVNMSADRNNVAQGMSSMSDSIDSSISNPQVALAYKNKIKSEGISQLSKINQDEARTNVGIEDTNISRNLQVDAMNNQGQMQAASMKLQKDMSDINNNQNIIKGLSSDINQVYGNIKSSENEKQVMNLRKSMAEDDVRRRYNLSEIGIDPLQLNNMDENSKMEFLLGKGVKEEDLYKYIKSNNSTTPLPKGEIVPEGWMGKYGGKVRKYANGGYVYANGGIAGVNQELLNSRIADIPNVKDSNIGFGNTSMTPHYQPIDNVKDKFDNFDIPKLVQTYAVKMEEGKVNPVFDEFQKLLEEHGIKTRRTSGYRNSKTSSGKVSKHAVGHAIDIVPDGISFDDMYKVIYSSPKIREFATKNKIGILNEADDKVLRKTKGTGKHAHVSIGENIAMDFWNPEMSSNGIYTENFYKKHNISYE